jgi:mercuric ion binding protein
MKVVRLVLIMVVVLSAVMSVNAQKKNEKTVIFNANLRILQSKSRKEYPL